MMRKKKKGTALNARVIRGGGKGDLKNGGEMQGLVLWVVVFWSGELVRARLSREGKIGRIRAARSAMRLRTHHKVRIHGSFKAGAVLFRRDLDVGASVGMHA